MSNTSQRLALELASSILAELDVRAKLGVREPLSAEQNAHLVGILAERHGLKPKQIKKMFGQIPWAMHETQKMADANSPFRCSSKASI